MARDEPLSQRERVKQKAQKKMSTGILFSTEGLSSFEGFQEGNEPT